MEQSRSNLLYQSHVGYALLHGFARLVPVSTMSTPLPGYVRMVPPFAQCRKVHDQFNQPLRVLFVSSLRWGDTQGLLHPRFNSDQYIHIFVGRLYGLGAGPAWETGTSISASETGVGLFKGLGLLFGDRAGFLGTVFLGGQVDTHEHQRYSVVVHTGTLGSLEVNVTIL